MDKQKKIIFEDTDRRHADLKIRLHYDGLNQGTFFRMLVSGYIEGDPRIIDFVREYRENNRIQSKRNISRSKNLYEKSQELKNIFVLGDEEIENIFDVIAEENQDI